MLNSFRASRFFALMGTLLVSACTDPSPDLPTAQALSNRADAAGADSNVPPDLPPAAATDCGFDQVLCGHRCINLMIDPHNCGNCGYTCARHDECRVGHCVLAGDPSTPAASETTRPQTARRCAVDETDCGQGCLPIEADPSNCGTCARACPGGQSCSAAVCGRPR